MNTIPTPAATPELCDARNRSARAAALAGPLDSSVGLTGLVGYSSAGRVLIVAADAATATALAAQAAPLRPAVLLTGGVGATIAGVTTWHVPAAGATLRGWLGDFRLRIPEIGEGEERFDLVLDLGETPLITAELPPPGYLSRGGGEESPDEALATLKDLVGEFEKPRYFAYDPDICAHGMKGATACRRCIDACPAEAIESLVDRVRVEPHLCQGGGACATACPTGAITYGYPPVGDLLTRVRRLIAGYLDAGGSDPVLLVHDAEAGAAIAAPLVERHGNLLPLVVEEVASLGLEAWLSALAYGARAVRLVDTDAVPDRSRAEVDVQLGFAREMLGGIGLPPQALGWLAPASGAPEPVMPALIPAQHAALGGKRQILFAAMDHLAGQAPVVTETAALSVGAPFGDVVVDADACTLCLACVTVCPGKALQDGHDRPMLRLIEGHCVQCGLCERSCPEQAITLAPRFLYDSRMRSQPRVLREDSPFQCVSCGKPFATVSVIGRMQQRLADHAMFREPEARRRLSMCGDCRVADMMRAGQL